MSKPASRLEQEVASGRAEPPFVGRGPELAALGQALADSRQGASVVVLLEGEPGVGTSRLMRHFLEQVRQQPPPALVLSSRCLEHESVRYKGADGLVDALGLHLSGLGADAVRELWPADGGALLQLFPSLRLVPGLEAASRSVAHGNPLLTRLAAFHALRELLARLASRAPVVLAVEDVPWADRDALALLEEVLRAPGLLLVGTVHAGALPHGPSQAAAARFLAEARWLPVGGLAPEEVQALLERLPGAEPFRPPEQALRLAQESGGNPLVIEARVRAPKPAEPQPGPVSFDEAVWARVRQLEPAACQLLELLTLANAPLPLSVASHAAELALAETARLVGALCSARLARASGVAGTDVIEVAHERVRHVLEAQLDEEAQAQWYARLASALEVQAPGSAEGLAHHWRAAGREERAVGYYRRAAAQASEALAFSRQAALSSTVLELGFFEPAERRRLQVAYAEALAHAGLGAESASALLEATEGAPEDEARTLRRRAAALYLGMGRLEEGLRVLRALLAEAGVRYPESPTGAGASLRWQRLRLALRPLRLRPRPRESLPAPLLRQLDACWTAGTMLADVEPVRASGFLALHLRLSLDEGDALNLLRACAAEALALAAAGPRSRPRLRRMLEQLEPLGAPLAGELLPACYLGLVRAADSACAGEPFHVRGHLEPLLARLARVPAEEAWVKGRVWALWVEASVLAGELAELERRRALALAEARERGERATLTALQLGALGLPWLARGEVHPARQAADEARALWPSEGPVLALALRALTCANADLYEGHSSEALRRLEVQRPEVLGDVRVRALALELRARALLLEAARGGGGEAQRLRVDAEADARRLERTGLAHAPVQAGLLRAGAALQEGRREQALALYTQAGEGAEALGLRLYQAAARWRQGELLGGEGGQGLQAGALAVLRAQGVLAPEALLALYAPAPSR